MSLRTSAKAPTVPVASAASRSMSRADEDVLPVAPAVAAINGYAARPSKDQPAGQLLSYESRWRMAGASPIVDSPWGCRAEPLSG